MRKFSVGSEGIVLEFYWVFEELDILIIEFSVLYFICYIVSNVYLFVFM